MTQTIETPIADQISEFVDAFIDYRGSRRSPLSVLRHIILTERTTLEAAIKRM